MSPRLFSVLAITALAHATVDAADWPQFRGPGSLGQAPADARPPRVFSPETNVAWRIPLPTGNSSPVLAGDRLFVTAFAREQGELLTLALDARTGRELWRRALAPNRVEEVHRSLGSPASATPVVDASRLFVHFGSFGLAAYSLDGTELWKRPLPTTETEYGASSSPIIAGDLVIQLLDQDGGSHLLAVRKSDGAIAWRVDRPEMRRGFGTPVLWTHHGRTDLVVPGTIFMTGLDPVTGTERWRVDGLARITCTSPIVHGDTLFAASWTTGGDRGRDRIELPAFDEVLKGNDRDADGRLAYTELPAGPASERKKHLDGNRDGFVERAEWESMAGIFRSVENQAWALRAGPDGAVSTNGVLWRFKRGLPYVASPTVADGAVYLVKNGGFLTRLDATTGRADYQEERLPGTGDYYASPLLADGHLYVASQQGMVSVVKAGPRFELVHKTDLGEPIHASPVPNGPLLYIRTRDSLFAFGQRAAVP